MRRAYVRPSPAGSPGDRRGASSPIYACHRAIFEMRGDDLDDGVAARRLARNPFPNRAQVAKQTTALRRICC